MSDRRELYRSLSGDAWFLQRDLVIHEPNQASGGQATSTDVAAFLASGNGPEHQALHRIIATLEKTAPDEDDVDRSRWRIDVMSPQDEWIVHSYYEDRMAAIDQMDRLNGSGRLIEEKVVLISLNTAAKENDAPE